MVDDGSFRRLRFGTAFPYGITNLRYLWFKWKGGMQHIRIYNGIILSFLQLENLRINKYTITEMPIGSPALAGSVLILDPASFIGYDNIAFDEGGFESSAFEGHLLGFPGYDQQADRLIILFGRSYRYLILPAISSMYIQSYGCIDDIDIRISSDLRILNLLLWPHIHCICAYLPNANIVCNIWYIAVLVLDY